MGFLLFVCLLLLLLVVVVFVVVVVDDVCCLFLCAVVFVSWFPLLFLFRLFLCFCLSKKTSVHFGVPVTDFFFFFFFFKSVGCRVTWCSKTELKPHT